MRIAELLFESASLYELSIEVGILETDGDDRMKRSLAINFLVA